MSIVDCQLSRVDCHLSRVDCQLSIVDCQLSRVDCHLSMVYIYISIFYIYFIYVDSPYFIYGLSTLLMVDSHMAWLLTIKGRLSTVTVEDGLSTDMLSCNIKATFHRFRFRKMLDREASTNFYPIMRASFGQSILLAVRMIC